MIHHMRNSILQLFQVPNGILNKIESFTVSIKTGNPEYPNSLTFAIKSWILCGQYHASNMMSSASFSAVIPLI